jgi:hypothetical protein
MTNYQKIFPVFLIGFLVLIFGLLIYANATSDKISVISKRLHTVSPDSLKQIIISPTNPNWNINLTIETIKITNKLEIEEITSQLNNMNKKYRGRGIGRSWEAIMLLDFENGSSIKLKVVDAQKGICVFYNNTMGNPKYQCNGLKDVLEKLSNYSGNKGTIR